MFFDSNHSPNTLEEINNLESNKIRTWLSGLAQQTGINIVEGNSPIVDEFNISQEKKFHTTAPLKSMPIVLQTEASLATLTGLSGLINELRNHLLELPFITDKNIQSLPSEEETDFIHLNKKNTLALLEDKPSTINKYIKSQVRIRLLLSVIDKLSPKEQKNYRVIKAQLQNWQLILKEILPNLDKNNNLQQLIEQEYQDQNKDNNESERLSKLMSGERVGEKGAKALRKKIINVLVKKTSTEQKEVVGKDLADELFNTADVINDIRIIERLKKEGINLISIKKEIKQIKLEYQNKPEKKEFLNKKIIDLIIPIANTIAKIFPHKTNNSPSLVAACLYRNEAVCTGKTAILSKILSLLGLENFNSVVLETFIDRSEHTFCRVLLPDNKTELLIDTNASSYHNLDQNLINRFSKYSTQTKQKIEANKKHIPLNSDVLIYTAHKTTEGSAKRLKINHYVMLNQHGQKEHYKSSVPYPHLIICQELKSEMSAAAHYNYALLILNFFEEFEVDGKIFPEQALHHYLKAIELSPSYFEAHANCASLLYDNRELIKLDNKIILKRVKHHLLEALKINSEDEFVNFEYANLLANHYKDLELNKKNAFQQAEYYYRKALSINSSSAKINKKYHDFLEKQKDNFFQSKKRKVRN